MDGAISKVAGKEQFPGSALMISWQAVDTISEGIRRPAIGVNAARHGRRLYPQAAVIVLPKPQNIFAPEERLQGTQHRLRRSELDGWSIFHQWRPQNGDQNHRGVRRLQKATMDRNGSTSVPCPIRNKIARLLKEAGDAEQCLRTKT